MGVGELAHPVAIPERGDAGLVKAVAGRLWFSDWLRAYEDSEGRMSESRVDQEGGGRAYAWFVGLARAKFGYGLALVGVTSAMKSMTSRRLASPRKGGSRLHVTSGMSRRAIQELGAWKSP